ncbi:hypothetical protein DSL92_07665 [Billgrantia gudaonensis]|uniref:Uncharacterized protein n=1 Tax=Billgrantia gudaonensis TaxID=376427 RepID=A0A3S0Q0W2_9GAMM|nr:hypothetical protein DSL92_07665 [Halomonas gudaonensis]
MLAIAVRIPSAATTGVLSRMPGCSTQRVSIISGDLVQRTADGYLRVVWGESRTRSNCGGEKDRRRGDREPPLLHPEVTQPPWSPWTIL